MIESVTGVVLAGGKSNRMGRNKALLPYQGKNLIDAPIAKLSQIFSSVVLSVRDQTDLSGYDLKKISDLYPGIGPMSGIVSVLNAGYERIFCVACDMPFLEETLIRYLCGFSAEDAVIPMWRGRPEVMHAIYSRPLLPAFQSAINAGHYKITNALTDVAVYYLEEKEVRGIDAEGKSFRNVNSPADYEKL